jgi:Na+/melibiose symporter-like transporter
MTRWGLIFVGVTTVSLLWFIRWERHARYPLIPLRLFAIRAFSRNLLSGMAYWILMMFPAFLLPFYLRYDMHVPVSVIGLSLVPQALTMIIVAPFGGRWLDQVGVLKPGRLGMGLLLFADGLFAVLPRHVPLEAIWGVLALVGAGAGLYSSPNNAAVLNSVRAADTGLASSLLATQRNLGRAIGVALASILLSLTWILYGLGPSPSHLNPHYGEWFFWGFRGVFVASLGFGLLGLLTLTAPATARH